MKDTVERGHIQNVHILLLTCATSRAIHLELTPRLMVDAFLRAVKRFTSKSGKPDVIVSDNAKTYKAAETERYMLSKGIKQKFILVASP